MDAWWLEPRGPVRLTVAAGGDVGLVGRLRARLRAGLPVLEAPARTLREADLATANLEFPVAAGAAGHEHHHDPEAPRALREAGITVVALGNNHMMDHGEAGLRSTLEACERHGLATVGAGVTLEEARRPVCLVARGVRVGMLSYATPHRGSAARRRPGTAPFEPDLVREDLRALRPEVDALVVHAHWGSMYVDDPSPRALEWGRLLAEEGADVVIGHHPHVLQGVERRGRALVAYSLGDLAFDPSVGDFYARVGREQRRRGAVLTFALAGEAHGVRVHSLLQDQEFVPRDAPAHEAAAMLERLRRLSQELGAPGDGFARRSGPALLRYEVESALHYLRRGRLDKLGRLALALRPRHLPLLWNAMRRRRRAESA